jgi:UDP-N-acetylglucosamine 2-epimerase (non-hydrolysing)
MILLVYGTRPEYIKIKSLIEKMKEAHLPFRTLFTGQHKDLVEVKSDFSAEISDFGENRLDSIIQSLLNLQPDVFVGVDYVLVQGDTTSALALSITALNRKIKVIHLEAGLRTYDFENPFPEEYNRQLISRVATIHLCPTQLNQENLNRENIHEGIYVVGNTGLDGINSLKGKCSYGKKVLVTLHRRENHHEISKWFSAIEDLAVQYSDYEFILPLHPNPEVQKHRDLFKRVNVINPLSRNQLLEILVDCSLVITDSGGLQEECSFFNKKCLVCRKVTERPESLGKTSFLVENVEDLLGLFSDHIRSSVVNESCPFGDGNSSQRIIEILKGL